MVVVVVVVVTVGGCWVLLDGCYWADIYVLRKYMAGGVSRSPEEVAAGWEVTSRRSRVSGALRFIYFHTAIHNPM